MSERNWLWTTTDPRGFQVSLSSDTWEHIVEEHRPIAAYSEAVKLAIEDPDEIYFDEWSTQQKTSDVWVEAYYKRKVFAGFLRTKLLFVSVKFVPTTDGTQGLVQTAVPNRRVSGRMVLKWKKSE